MIAKLGVSSSIKNRLAKALPWRPAAPPSPSTGSGTTVVVSPPTKVPPPNSAQLVSQAVTGSAQLDTNTSTGLGIGAGRNATIATKTKPSKSALIWLGVLGAILFAAFVIDRGNI